MSNSFILKYKICFLTTIVLLLNGCSYTKNDPLVDNIYNDSNNIDMLHSEPTVMLHNTQKSLFEDYHAHNIGDTMTIVLQENTSASNSSTASITRNGHSNIGISTFPNPFNILTTNNINKSEFNTSGKHDYSGKGSNTTKNMLTGIITVTVNNILPNGNLQVVGEKTININHGTEQIRFSGIVNPNIISNNNSVVSTQVADAYIEYLNNDAVDHNKNHMGWLQRLFFKISPM
ncbi:MAG: flagellar basal body L-ring protein FlgH [Buchnera aphidicola (Eriosoma harunire)]